MINGRRTGISITVVAEALILRSKPHEFADLFSCEPQRRHFGEYLTGLMIAERKSVSGINREFAVTTDESFEDHTILFCQLVDWVCERNIPGDFTFDSDFSNAENLNHIHSKQHETGRSRGYVGDLKTNRINWEVSRILGVYRYRWTETFHRDGKQELGMGDCQLRDGQGQPRHMYLDMLAYSLLARQLGQGRAQDWALQKLTTIGEACRAMLRETLSTTLAWAIQQVSEKSSSYDHVIAKLDLT